MAFVKYCPKCGYIDCFGDTTCIFCDTKMLETDIDNTEYLHSKRDRTKEIKQDIYERYVYNNPLYDEVAFKKQYETHEESVKAMYQTGGKPLYPKEQNKITCPYCKSNNVSKISTFDRSVSVGLFGLGSGKIGKQWKCNNCKSNF